MTKSPDISAKDVYDLTFDTNERYHLTYRDDSGQERIKYDIERCKDLFRALLETLSPEQLEKVSDYLKYDT